IDGHGGHSLLPGTGRHRVVKVELRGGLYDGVGSESSTSSVRGRHVPRNGKQHETRIVLVERKTEIIAVVDTHSVRVEIFHVHSNELFIVYKIFFLLS